MVSSISCGFNPSPTESDPCGSKSTSSTLRPYSASDAPRLIVVVVLPTPPFWLHIEITRALPWAATGAGSGITGIGRPVGPSAPGASAATAGSGSAARRSNGWNSTGSARGSTCVVVALRAGATSVGGGTSTGIGLESTGPASTGEGAMVSLGSLGGAAGGGGGAADGGISG